MDNTTFHKGRRIEQLIENMGCKLLYLPPYSPDLNKIEQRRVKVKESHPQKTGSVWLFTFWRSRMSYALPPAPTKAVAILRKFYLRKSAISQKLIERHWWLQGDDYRNFRWTTVRFVRSGDLLKLEYGLRCFVEKNFPYWPYFPSGRICRTLWIAVWFGYRCWICAVVVGSSRILVSVLFLWKFDREISWWGRSLCLTQLVRMSRIYCIYF